MRIARAALAVFVAAGCTVLPPRPDPSRFYTLAPREARGPAAARGEGLAVVVGPVTFPAYLDRNEVAMRVSPSESATRQACCPAAPPKQQST